MACRGFYGMGLQGLSCSPLRIIRHLGSSAGVHGMSRTRYLQRWAALAILLTLILGSPLLSWAHTPPRLPMAFAQLPQHGGDTSQPWVPVAPSGLPVTPGVLL